MIINRNTTAEQILALRKRGYKIIGTGGENTPMKIVDKTPYLLQRQAS